MPPRDTPDAARSRRRAGAWAVRLVAALAALLLIAYLGISLMVASALTVPYRQTLNGDPRTTVGLDYQAITVAARGDETPIAAWYIPAPGSRRALLFVHGKDGCRTCEFGGNALQFAAAMQQRGFSMLLLDLRGHGQSGDARFTFGLRERDDIGAALDWLLAQGYAPGRIGLVGVSMGAASSIGAAAENPAIGALVADSSYADIAPILEQEFPQASGLPDFFLPSSLFMGRFVIGADIGSSRPVAEIAALAPRPVLLIHAAGDTLIPAAHAEQLAAAYPAAQLWIIPGQGHVQTYPYDPAAYVERVSAFFAASMP